MAMTMEEAAELVESVFDFDHLGNAMLAVRKNLNSQEAQHELLAKLVEAATEELNDGSEETLEALTSAARARVEQFVKGSKFSQSGCSGM